MSSRRALLPFLPARFILCLASLAALAIVMMPLVARAQNAVVADDTGSDDGIAETIRARDSQLHDEMKTRKSRRTTWMHELGLDVAFTYDALALGALGEDDGWGSSAGDATLNVRWQINADSSKAPFSLNMRARHRHAYSDLSPSELRRETCALWGYVDGFTDAGLEVPEVYFEDRLFDKRLTLRLGLMAIDDLLDSHRLRSAKRSFLNQAFSSSPGVGFPGAGMGLIARWEDRSGWDATLAVSNLESSNLDETAKWRLKSDALFEAVQLGYKFDGLAGKPARVQLMAWNADALPEAGLSSGRGANLTLEQKWGARGRSFLRYAWADGEAAATAHFAALGAALDFREADRLGVSVAGGKSSDEEGDRQGVLEIFYRRQIGTSLFITPDFQFVIGDGIGGGADWLLIGGVRVGFTF